MIDSRDGTPRRWELVAVAAAVGLVAMTASAPAAADEARPQLGLDQRAGTPGVDGRWLPWLGCWKLSADAVDYREVEVAPADEQEGDRLVCLSPRLDGAGVGVLTLVGQQVVLEETLVADGERRPFEAHECRGWQETRWSRDGQRLFVRNQVACGGETARASTGVSFIADRGVWVDVQLVRSLDDDRGEGAELLVKRYVRAGAGETMAAGLTPLSADDALRGATARASAAGSLDVPDVVEAVERVDPEVVEALILESQPRFDIDAETLGALASAEVPGHVIDLMIAVSYPDDFIVDRRGGVDEADPYRGRPRAQGYAGYPYYYGYSPFLPFYSPFYGQGTRVFLIPGRGDVDGDGSLFGGRVVKGRGYTSVRARQPDTGGSFLSRLGRGTSGTSGGSAVGGSGSDSGGSVTPEGHRGGGTRKAKPRGGEER